MEKVIVGIFLASIIAIGAVALGFITAAVAGVVLMLGFNHGIVPLLAAFGAKAVGVGFWTSFWSAWTISTFGGLVFGGLKGTAKFVD